MKHDPIPQSDSIEELARFWETHDLADYDDELEEVAEPVFECETVLRVRLPSEEAETVRRLAESKGVAAHELIRQWIVERAHAGA